jgi:hydrogenase-4 component F
LVTFPARRSSDLHLLLVLIAGIWLPGPLVEWFQNVAALLG